MNTKTTVLLLISTMTFISAIALGDSTPLFTILGKDVMREEISLQSEPSEDTQRSIDAFYPGGRPDNWAECFRIKEMIENIIPVIQSKFFDENKLRPTEEEIATYMERLKYVYEYPDGLIFTIDLSDDIDQQMLRHQAIQSLSEWKWNVALYEKYGGRIATINNNETIRPIDAAYALLKDAEGDGTFTIHDNDLRALFWSCMTNYPVTYLSDEDGKSALYRHPADKFVDMVKKLNEVMSKAETNIDSKEDDINDKEGK